MFIPCSGHYEVIQRMKETSRKMTLVNDAAEPRYSIAPTPRRAMR
jgi:hypothetical protein